MRLRPVGPSDLAAVTELQRAYDTAWFGDPEHDENEVREWLDLAETAGLVEERGRVLAVASRWRTGSAIVAPDGTTGVLDLLVPWLAEVGAPSTEALDRDGALRSALDGAGWRYAYSSFELLRDVDDAAWLRGQPGWPEGVELRPFEAADAIAVHDLIYARAGWAEIAGHFDRDLAEWRRIFLDGRPPHEAPIVAWRGDRPVGTVLVRLYSDGTGWVPQLAVDREERGRGLGRALLHEGFRRLVARGASTLGLGAVANNRTALRLYLGVGLRIDREWQTYASPAQAGGPPEELPAHTGGSA